jgi:hypothetical protein
MLRKFDIKSDLFVAISMIRVMVYLISLLEICSVIGGKLRVRDNISICLEDPYPARIRVRVSVSGGYGYDNTAFYEKIRYVDTFYYFLKI